MIQFKCACCGQLLQLADEWAGKVAKCPFSGQYMQVPLPNSMPPPVPMPGPVPAPAAAGGGGSWNPFASASPSYEPPPAEFGNFSTAVSTATQGQVRIKSQRVAWQTRGAFLGAAGGLVLGGFLGLIVGAASKSGPGVMPTALTIALGGVTLGAGVGGIIGPLVLIVKPGVKSVSGAGAVMGALYGTVRVGGFGAVGGLLTGLLSGAFVLLKSGEIAAAGMAGILTALLMALGWAAAGAILGVFFGAALGAVGGYD